MSIEVLEKPGGGESSPLFPKPQSSAEKDTKVASLLEKKRGTYQV